MHLNYDETVRNHIIAAAEQLGAWYHAIELVPGYTTKSFMAESFPQWDNVREVRKALDYTGKTVLDLGSMDGMWAFEAERLGAKSVVASDAYQNCGMQVVERLMLARFALGSRVIPLIEGDAHRIAENSAIVRRLAGATDGFDIVQCLGMLYHVEHPLMVLGEIRRLLKTGGRMLLETACWDTPLTGPAMRANWDMQIYNDWTTFWSPNKRCLDGMLKATGFGPPTNELYILEGNKRRIACVCDAI